MWRLGPSPRVAVNSIQPHQTASWIWFKFSMESRRGFNTPDVTVVLV